MKPYPCQAQPASITSPAMNRPNRRRPHCLNPDLGAASVPPNQDARAAKDQSRRRPTLLVLLPRIPRTNLLRTTPCQSARAFSYTHGTAVKCPAPPSPRRLHSGRIQAKASSADLFCPQTQTTTLPPLAASIQVCRRRQVQYSAVSLLLPFKLQRRRQVSPSRAQAVVAPPMSLPP